MFSVDSFCEYGENCAVSARSEATRSGLVR